jgi:hypothetical protein
MVKNPKRPLDREESWWAARGRRRLEPKGARQRPIGIRRRRFLDRHAGQRAGQPRIGHEHQAPAKMPGSGPVYDGTGGQVILLYRRGCSQALRYGVAYRLHARSRKLRHQCQSC